MRPKTHIIAGWVTALTAVAAGAVALPAMADKVDAQRSETVLTAQAAEFRSLPERDASTAAVTRLVELYGPDSLVEAPLRRVAYDLSAIDHDTSNLRREAAAVQREADCMATAVYYEARSETRAGQIAVAQVITNRVRSKHFPNSVCGVVYQGSTRSSGCQFSFTCDGSLDAQPKGRAWTRSRNVARLVLSQPTKNLVGRSTHYHTTEVSPDWSATLKRQRTVGSHVFYSFPWRERNMGTVSLAVAPPPS